MINNRTARKKLRNVSQHLAGLGTLLSLTQVAGQMATVSDGQFNDFRADYYDYKRALEFGDDSVTDAAMYELTIDIHNIFGWVGSTWIRNNLLNQERP